MSFYPEELKTSFRVRNTCSESYIVHWLMAHQIVPDQRICIWNSRLIDEKSYERTRKKVHFDNVVMDLIRSEDGDLAVCGRRVQGCGKCKMPLFYLYKLNEYE